MVENVVPNRHVMLRIFVLGQFMNHWMEWGNRVACLQTNSYVPKPFWGPYLSEILKYVSYPLENMHENAKNRFIERWFSSSKKGPFFWGR